MIVDSRAILAFSFNSYNLPVSTIVVYAFSSTLLSNYYNKRGSEYTAIRVRVM